MTGKHMSDEGRPEDPTPAQEVQAVLADPASTTVVDPTAVNPDLADPEFVADVVAPAGTSVRRWVNPCSRCRV